MISQESFMGRATRLVLNGSDKDISPHVARVWRVEQGSGMAAVKLPNTVFVPFGHPTLVVFNTTGSSLSVKNAAGSVIASIPSLQVGIINCIGPESWDIFSRTYST